MRQSPRREEDEDEDQDDVGDDSDPDAPLPCAERLSADVKKLKWIDDRVIKMADQHRCLDFGRAEIIVALANLVHGPLHKRNRHAFTREELFRLLNKAEHMTVADDIARLFLSKFDPQSPLAAAEVASKAAAISATIACAMRAAAIAPPLACVPTNWPAAMSAS